MHGNPLPSELHAPLHAAYDSVTRHGRHLSSALEALFRAISPDADLAATLRRTVTQAVRYGDLQGALAGTLLDVEDGSRFYLPSWLRKHLQESLGPEYGRFLEGCVSEAPATLRVNTVRTNLEACVQALAPFHPTHIQDQAIVVEQPFGLFKTEAFAEGWFEQQDLNSQRVSLSVQPEPGMRVVDSCAGAGGKSLHMAALMENRGKILALDTVEEKLEACQQRAARDGVDIIETRHISTTKVVKRMAESADRVLIDAPCTGTGVLRRNPDIPWHLTEDGYRELLETQAQILKLHSRMLKPGGRLVYAVCSVLHGEGPGQVQAFVANNAEFTLVEEWRTMPGENGGDGFYVAVLTRSAASSVSALPPEGS